MFGSMGQSAVKNLGNGGTIDGDLTITGDLQVSGGGSLSFDEIIEGTQVIDVTSTEALLVRKNSDGGDILTVDTTNSTVKFGTDGSGADVTFYSATAGDSFVWDASEEKLTITGTNGQTALDVADGNLVVADNVDIEGDIDVNGTSNLDDVDIDGDVDISGSITNATWTGDVIASAYLDSDTAHLSGSQTFSGEKTFSANIIMADDTSIGISDSDERIEFDGAGDISVLGANFGIGVSDPDSELEIFHATDPQIKFTINTHGDAGIMLGDADGLKLYGKGASNNVRLYSGASTLQMKVDANGITTYDDVVFNEDSADVDFRVESNGNANMLYVDGGNDRVGVGAAPAEATFEVAGTSGEISKFGTLTNDWAANHAFGIVNGNGIMISDVSGANNTAANRVMALQRDDTNGHAIYIYDPSGNVDIALKGNSSSYVKGGSFGVGTDSPASKFQVVDTSNMKYENNQLVLTRAGGHLFTLLNASTAIANTNALGYLRFNGNENGAGEVTGGSIEVHAEKDWSGNSDCPTRMTFWTTNDGSANATEKMRITEAGDVGIGQTSPTVRLHIKDDNSLDDCQLKVENDGTGDAGIGFLLTGVIGFAMGIDNSHANNALIIGGNDDAIGTTPYLTINPSDSSVSGDLSDTSDVAFKENIQTLSEGLSIVKKINPVSFDWKDKNKGSNSGFIAQEIEKILPNDVCGKDYNAETSPEGKSINVTGIVAHLTKAVQELSARVEELESK